MCEANPVARAYQKLPPKYKSRRKLCEHMRFTRAHGGTCELTRRRLDFERGQMKAHENGEAIHTSRGCQRPPKELGI